MKLHLAGDVDIDPDAFERTTLAELGMPKEIVMRHRTPHFSHIFAGDDYSAGYYSYLWSDALTADAAEVFEEAGDFYNPDIARSLHDNIMSVGDTIDPAAGFRAFRGRDVDTTAPLAQTWIPGRLTNAAEPDRGDCERLRTALPGDAYVGCRPPLSGPRQCAINPYPIFGQLLPVGEGSHASPSSPGGRRKLCSSWLSATTS